MSEFKNSIFSISNLLNSDELKDLNISYIRLDANGDIVISCVHDFYIYLSGDLEENKEILNNLKSSKLSTINEIQKDINVVDFIMDNL